jgi:glycosyltransferase involved in cell wall biosynthesis
MAARRLLGIDHVQVVPNGVDTTRFTPSNRTPTGSHLLFTGRMDSALNIEAVRHFSKNVLPRILHDVPAAQFHIVGSHKEAVSDLASESVLVHGPVDDPLPYFRQAAVVVIPMLHGGGSHQKTLMAASCGKAIVSTPLGVEGLNLRPGEEYLEAGPGPEFAAAVVQLLRNEPLRRRLEQHVHRIAQYHDWDRIGSLYCQIVENLAAKPVRFGRSRQKATKSGAAGSWLDGVSALSTDTIWSRPIPSARASRPEESV